jgi:fibronectin type 3 domain-containing protein
MTGKPSFSALWLRLFFAAVSLCIASFSVAQPAAPSATWVVSYNSAADVYWNPVPGATSYAIYRGTTPGGESTTAIVSNQTSIPYYDTPLTNGTKYYYKVKAFYGGLPSPLSLECSVSPGATNPPAPACCGLAGATSAEIIISPSPGATEYRIFRAINGSYVFTAIGVTGTDVFTDTGLVANQQYQYKVDSVSVNGEGGTSNTFYVIPGDTAPLAPSYLGGQNHSGYSALYWNPVPGAQSYAVFRSTTAGGESTPLAVTSGTTFNDSSIVNGSTYFYKVRSMDEGGCSGFDAVEAEVTPGNTILTAPTVAAEPTTTSVKLDWTGVAGVTGYVIFRSQTVVNGNQYVELVTTTTPTYTDTGVVSGISYEYTIAGYNHNGIGTFSAATYANPGDPPLAAPTGLAVTPSGSSVASLSWNPCPGAATYNIYRAPSGTPILVGSSTYSSYYDSGLTPALQYSYQVTAVYNGSEGAPCPIITGVPGATRLAAPEMAPMEVSGQTTLYWGLVPGALSYNVFRQITNTATVIATLVKPATGATNCVYTDLTAAPGVEYTYSVAAVNAHGLGTQTPYEGAAAGSSSPPTATGLIATSSGASINVSWNPFVGQGVYIYRSSTSNAEGYVPIGYSTTDSFYDSTPLLGTLYYYKVRVSSGENLSAFSAQCNGEANQAPLPAPVVGGYAAAANTELVWSAITGATNYNVYRAVGLNGTFSMFQQNLPYTTLLFSDTNVNKSQIFYYKVQAVNAMGAGNLSSAVSLRPGTTFTVATNGVWVYPSGSTANGFGWNPVPGALSYNVYRSTTTGTEGTRPIATNITSTSYYDSSAAASARYFYKVTAVTQDCQGPQSAEVTVLTSSNTLTAPTLTLKSTTTTTATFTWNTISGATSYNIFRSSALNGNVYVLYKNLATATLTDTGLIHGLQYNYQVEAVGANGAGNLSSPVTASP